MAFCRDCGNQLPDNAKFCSKCGNAISVSKVEESTVSNNTGSENPEGNDGSLFSGCFKGGLKIIFLIIVIVLFFTNPNETKFEQYLFEYGSGTGLESILFDSRGEFNRKNYLLFSIYEVELDLSLVTVRERHIGIFNRFKQLEQ